MIIQIRSTSGSGKSTVMREVMEKVEGVWGPKYAAGRKKPLWYRNGLVVVLGHYESPCGGCDTIGSARQVFDLIQDVGGARVILCEGLLLSEDTKWAIQLNNLRALFLITSLEVCLKRIIDRRLAVGNNKPLNPSNTSRRVAVIDRARVKLTNAGIRCCRASQKQAPAIILRWIREECCG